MNKSYKAQYETVYNNNRSKYILAIFFIITLSSMILINMINPDSQMSEAENRFLRQRPKLSFNALLEGSFSKRFEEYISDQFSFRNTWVTIKTTSQLILGRRDNNEVYYGKGGRLYEIVSFNEKTLEKNLDALEKFVGKLDLPISLLPAPSASYIQPEGLPKHVLPNHEDLLWEKVEKALPSFHFIQSIDRLKEHSHEYLYYYSDHHWTTLGAYYAYSTLMEAWNKPLRQISDYSIINTSQDFLGALHSKSGYRNVKPDSITIFAPEVEVIVEYNRDGRKTNTLFETSKLDIKDKYSVFMDGNHPLVTVKSNEGHGKLLILKDSFAHSLVPLMAGQFEEIHMIDLRYFRESISSYIDNNDISEVLAIYSASSLGSQTFISQLR